MWGVFFLFGPAFVALPPNDWMEDMEVVGRNNRKMAKFAKKVCGEKLVRDCVQTISQTAEGMVGPDPCAIGASFSPEIPQGAIRTLVSESGLKVAGRRL